LHRLQCEALEAAARSLSKASTGSENATTIEELVRTQGQWAHETVQRAISLNVEFLTKLMAAGLGTDMASPSRAEPEGSASASIGNTANGSTIWPTDLVLGAHNAWGQWAQQLVNTINRGAIPS
jgi:hypothetical protein